MPKKIRLRFKKPRKILVHARKPGIREGHHPWTLQIDGGCMPIEGWMTDESVQLRGEERLHLDSNPKIFNTAEILAAIHTGGDRYLLTNKTKARPNARTRARRQHR